MKRFWLLNVCLFLLFVAMVSAQKNNETKKHTKSKPSKNVIIEPTYVSMLKISHLKISDTCEETDKDCTSNRIIELIAVSQEGVPDDRYQYTPSAGRIIGKGPVVKWDLSKVSPGVYRVTAGVLFESGFPTQPLMVLGQTRTRTIEILDCADCPLPENADPSTAHISLLLGRRHL